MIPIILGLIASALIGLNLVAPRKGVIVLVLFALVVTGMTSYFSPNWSQIAWAVSIASFALVFPSILSLDKAQSQRGNYLSLMMIIVIIYSSISLVIGQGQIQEAFSAAKNIFQFWSIPLLAYVGIVDNKIKSKLSKLILIVAIIQIPISLYQYFFVVDWTARLAGGDSVVGTFGGSADGGGDSGAQTTFLLIIWTFIVAIYIQQKKRRTLWLAASFLLLIPVLLNETKIFIIYLPIVIIQIFFSFSKSRPTRTFFVTGLMGAAGFGVIVFYFLFLQHTGYGVSASKDIESYIDRRVSSTSGLSLETREDIGLTRLGSIVYWWNEHSISNDSIDMFFGHGLGASKGYGIYLGHLYDQHKYRNLRLDRTGLSKFLWDLGIIGTMLYIMVFIAAYLMLVKVQRKQEKNSFEIAIIISAKIGLTILLVGNLYDTYLIRNQGLNILFTCLLAYTFYIHRHTHLKRKLIHRIDSDQENNVNDDLQANNLHSSHKCLHLKSRD